jgi:hypothetical protein
MKNLLVVGMDTVATARSAEKAGYKVFAADFFGDVDLRRVCSAVKSVIKQKAGKSCGRMKSKFKAETFLHMAKSLSERYEIDGILLSSGLDDDLPVLRELNDLAPILGNHSGTIERVRIKAAFFEELKRLGIAHPRTEVAANVGEAKTAAVEIGFPVVLKPADGFGGVGIRIARNSHDIGEKFLGTQRASRTFLVQKLIEGLHGSISLLAADEEVKVLTINEQLLGLPFLFQRDPFGYCGNTVPVYLDNSILEKCKNIAEKISLNFGLKGSNGIDLVLSREGTPYVVEVNPRFQGSLECVEKILDINLVEAHINSCLHDSLPTFKEPSTSCTRLILYAPRRCIAPDLTVFSEVRDIPLPGAIIEKGEPLCSVLTEGRDSESSLENGRRVAKSIYGRLQAA